MIEYRTFRNTDPPQILRLWQECGLGRGAAQPGGTEALELFIFSQQFFDPEGLTLACEGGRVIGFAHAGFGCSDDQSRLDRSRGVICAVMVHPDFRRLGVGAALVRKSEEYLLSRGATEMRAGPAPGWDPFFFGLYGGTRPSGFLESDPNARPFFESLNYSAGPQHGVFQRRLGAKPDPMNLRLATIRRETELIVVPRPLDPTWWWYTHFGRWESAGIDLLRFRLVRKNAGEPIAAVTVIGLEQYEPVWKQRAIGLVDVSVETSLRGQGYGQALLLGVMRRLKQELVDVAEIHSPQENETAWKVIQSAGFEQVDTGIVYVRNE
ncbi:MAG: GNAT family N-acetyltransferase [Planctomycetota bacterium]|nr:MAG: GNAT family N-acetyltransferase [Planctomycetota bacterium]REJ93488.1 MAG: GNAT family N-acetyltransferase [Planctomycetota bacterium]REK23200.1 MAG: GNAT family N-acetyltransferase [Planctomycetota bacterium]REK30882.1 MAG: GNAT family N-acetyltransferase [Planctomycetota bacterium]